jgi:transcriptional regulator with XRE-family HTH domain
MKSDFDTAAVDLARRFGELVRKRREQLDMRQDDLALTSGLGRRFILELERGKATAQLGKALLAANTLGLRPFDLMEENTHEDSHALPDLPETDDHVPLLEELEDHEDLLDLPETDEDV